MKVLAIALLFTIPILLATQAEKEQWQRVYSGEDMIIDIDNSKVIFVEDHVWRKVTFALTRVGRVRFRTIYSHLQRLKEDGGINYKTRIETIEFNCVDPTSE